MPCEGQHAMALNNGATLIPQSGATTFAMLSQIPSGTIQAYFVVTLFPAIKTYKTFVSVMEEPQPQQLWHLNSGTCLLSEPRTMTILCPDRSRFNEQKGSTKGLNISGDISNYIELL